MDRGTLREVRVKYAPLPTPGKRGGVVADASSIARPASGTARDRTDVHQSNLPEGTQPVPPGWPFSFVAVVPEEASSWVYTLDVERIPRYQTPVEVMGAQLIALIPRLAPGTLFLGDGGYGNVLFLVDGSGLLCGEPVVAGA